MRFSSTWEPTKSISINFSLLRERGKNIDFRDFEKIQDPETYDLAKKVFDRYQEIMIEHYRTSVKEVPGASDTFRWCDDNGIKVATDTGFHREITEAIMEGIGWLRDGLVDCSVDVEHVPGERGRPAPFMLFYAMSQLDIQSVHEVIKIGDTPGGYARGPKRWVPRRHRCAQRTTSGYGMGEILAHACHS